jgi:CubicO group peptidase (beta-lactamase class C family)
MPEALRFFPRVFQKHARLLVFLLCSGGATFLPPFAAAAQISPAPNLEGFDAFIERAMKDFKVPGAAVAVVQNDKIILAKGYGYRDMEKKLPVTTKTLFAVGSITKSFAVTTMGMLVESGLGQARPRLSSRWHRLCEQR